MLNFFPYHLRRVTPVICKLVEIPSSNNVSIYNEENRMCYNICLFHDGRLTTGIGRLANTIFRLTIPTASHFVEGVNGAVLNWSFPLFLSSSTSIVSLPWSSKSKGLITAIVVVVLVVGLASAKKRVRTAKGLFSVLIVPSRR